MGSSISTLRAVGTFEGPIDNLVLAEFDEITIERTLSNAPFLKTLAVQLPAKSNRNVRKYAIKVFVKSAAHAIPSSAIDEVKTLFVTLESCYNALPFSVLIESSRAIYGLRSMAYQSLYDRIYTRPFLEEIEQLWIVFQLLTILEDCHSKNIFHGDIKSENILISSNGTAYLTDFAFYKPIYLPIDNPADFSYFFDTSSKRTCYLAPERFKTEIQINELSLEKMDVFSLGCVFAELFLDGTRLFTLPQLFDYLNGDTYHPNLLLSRIQNKKIRDLINNMVKLNPEERLTFHEILNLYKSTLFPPCFYHVFQHYIPNLSKSLVKADQQIDKLTTDIQQLTFFLNPPLNFDDHLILNHYDFSNIESIIEDVTKITYDPSNNTIIIILNIVLSLTRSVVSVASKLNILNLISLMIPYVNDELKLDRCLPYAVYLMKDKNPIVQSFSIKLASIIFSSVTNIDHNNSFLFQDYLEPRLKALYNSSYTLVRMTLSATAYFFIKTACRHFRKFNSSFNQSPKLSKTVKAGLDRQRNAVDLITKTREMASSLILDSNPMVSACFLPNLTRIFDYLSLDTRKDILERCIQLLSSQNRSLRSITIKSLLSDFNFINEYLKHDLLNKILNLCFIDNSIANLCLSMQLFERILSNSFSQNDLMYIWPTVMIIVKYLLFPSNTLRASAISVIDAIWKISDPSDRTYILLPLLKPYTCKPLDKNYQKTWPYCLRDPFSPRLFRTLHQWSLQLHMSHYFSPQYAINPTYDSLIDLIHFNYNRYNASNIKKEVFNISSGSAADAKYLRLWQKENAQDEDYLKLFLIKSVIISLNLREADLTIKTSSSTLDSVSKLLEPQIAYLDYTKTLKGKPESEQIIKDGKTEVNCYEDIINSSSSKLLDSKIDNKAAVIGIAHVAAQGYITVSKKNQNPQPAELSESYWIIDDKSNIYLEQLLENARKRQLASKHNIYGSVLHEYSEDTDLAPFHGRFITNLLEHRAAITCITISCDSAYFATASSDGEVKLWDIAKIKKGISNQSLLSYTHPSRGSITAIEFISNSLSLATAADNGEISINRIQDDSVSKGNLKLFFNELITNFKLPNPGEYSFQMQSLKKQEHLYLIVATNCSIIYIYNLAELQDVCKLQISYESGPLTCFTICSNNAVLVAGTMLGVAEIWDMRFQVFIQKIILPTHSSIIDISMHFSANSDKHVSIVSNFKEHGFISIWNIQTCHCLELYCSSTGINALRECFVETSQKDQLISNKIVESLMKVAQSISTNKPFFTAYCASESKLTGNINNGYVSFHITSDKDSVLYYWDAIEPERSYVIDQIEQIWCSCQKSRSGKGMRIIEQMRPQKTDSSPVQISQDTTFHRSMNYLGITTCLKLMRKYGSTFLIAADANGSIRIFN